MNTVRILKVDLGNDLHLKIVGKDNDDKGNKTFNLQLISSQQGNGGATFNFQKLVELSNDIKRMVSAFNENTMR